MICKSFYVAAAIVGLAFVTAGPADDKKAPNKAAKAPASPAFENLKKLVGDWARADADGKPTGPVLTKFKLTASGTVLHETLFPGQAHEMVTVYHQDGPDVVCTHYCAMGNQPHLKMEAGSDPKRLVFQSVRLGNGKLETDEHMGHAIITIKDNDHYLAEWTSLVNGKPNPSHAAKLDLARKPKSETSK